MFSKLSPKSICIYLVVVILVSLGIGSIISASKRSGFLTFVNPGLISNLDTEKSVSIDGIKEIYIDNSSAQINIIKENRADLKAHATGKSTSSYIPELQMDAQGNRVEISLKRSTSLVVGVNYQNLKLNVYIPDSYKDDLIIHSSSGSVEIKDLTLSRFECKVSSGSVSISNISADNFSYDASSGSLNADSLTTKNSSVNASSGSIRIKNFTGNLKGHASSGSFKVQYKEFNNDINIGCSSGSVDVDLPDSSEFYLDAKASSGNVQCDFPISIKNKHKNNSLEGTVKNDENKVIINTSSGSIRIH